MSQAILTCRLCSVQKPTPARQAGSRPQLQCSARCSTVALAYSQPSRAFHATRLCLHSCSPRGFLVNGACQPRSGPLRSSGRQCISPLKASRKSGSDLEPTRDGDPAGPKVVLIAFGALLAVFVLPRLAVWSLMPLERMLVATFLNLEQQIASLAFVALRWIATAFGVLFALAFILVFLSSKTGANLEIWRSEKFWDVFNSKLEEELNEEIQEKKKRTK